MRNRAVRLGLIARADGGGLGAQTYEFYRNMRPARTLVALAPTARGTLRRDWYRPSPGQDVRFCKIAEVANLARWLFEGADVVYAAETFYSGHVAVAARTANARIVVHANPELWTPDDGGGTLWAPTAWALDRFPDGTPVVPFPVATDRLPYRRRERAEVLFHLGAPAFHDRAGTDIVLAAAPYLPEMRLLVRAERPRRWEQAATGARVEWLPPVKDYVDAIPDEADIMLAPRRYGGLSLPTQEAAARGLPVVMTNLEPQAGWLPAPLLAGGNSETLRVREDVPMRGGTYPVYDLDPECLARRVTALVDDPALLADMSDAVYAWALARSWSMLLPEYRERLGLPAQ